MEYEVDSINQYFELIPEERREVLTQIRKVISENIPPGFIETLNYGMPGYVIPHSIYPNGYHCDPKLPLPFINFASQKNFVAFYHMGIYADPQLLKWFISEYPTYYNSKLDMGKSCIRFKEMDDIPYILLGQLASKISVDEWISIYENKLKS